MPITLDGTNGITTPTYGGADTSEYLVPVTAFKNRIINGAMVIDQRNAGASVTFDTSNKFIVDRFYGFSNVGTTTAQRSTTAPADFINSVLVTQSTGGSVVSGSYLAVLQQVEGLNITDFNWGTANAKTVTLSFWVRSSITGTFSVALSNSAGDRTYVSNYTINSANTFEQKTITIPGDTGGTWLTTNGRGVGIIWNLGYGSSLTTSTLNSWITSGAIASTTATTSFASTTGATFYITGVQLEVGSTATSFDYRPYGAELALCQRYYEKSYRQSVAVPTNSSLNGFAVALANRTLTGSATNERSANIVFNTSKRAAPTITFYTLTNSTAGSWEDGGGNAIAMLTNGVSETAFIAYNNANVATNTGLSGHWVASIEL